MEGAPLNNQNASKYDPKYVDEVYKYIKKTKDRSKKVLKERNELRGRDIYINTLQVKLVTREGFARLIDVTTTTLLNWESKYKEFRKALRVLDAEQKDRLINGGLAGAYNPTIAKLLLSSNHGMKERIDTTTQDEPVNNFNDEQINRIAERVLKGRSDANGSASSEK